MKRILQVICLAVPVLVLGGCESLRPSEHGSVAPASRLQSILASGELRVGLSGSQPPLNMTDRQGQLIGMEVDLVRELARSMGLEVRLVTMPFARLLPALEQGQVDLVISGMTITPERNARVAFVGPYFISGKSVLTKSETIASVEDVAALDVAGRRYAALAGSNSEDFVKDVLPKAKLVATPDYDSAVQLVIDDQVDALVADYPACLLAVVRHPEAGLSMLVSPFSAEPLGIALPADDPLLVNLMQNYLNTLESTGLLTQLKARWFSRGSWIAELP